MSLASKPTTIATLGQANQHNRETTTIFVHTYAFPSLPLQLQP